MVAKLYRPVCNNDSTKHKEIKRWKILKRGDIRIVWDGLIFGVSEEGKRYMKERGYLKR